jgi:hypothetical protein
VYTVAHARSFGIAVATFDSVTGKILDTHVLDASLTSEMDLQVVGSHSAAPLAIWSEKGKIKVNILGSKTVTALVADVNPFKVILIVARLYVLLSSGSTFQHLATSLPHLIQRLFIFLGDSLPYQTLLRIHHRRILTP